jgi:hypothetical protein
MASTDPAVAAARRAWYAHGQLPWPYMPGEHGLWSPDAMEAAAGEALKPLRELHRPTGTASECVVCFDSDGRGRPWPCDTARLVYTAHELGQEHHG